MNGPEVNADGVVTMQATLDYEKVKRDEMRKAQTFVKAATTVITTEKCNCLSCGQPFAAFAHLATGAEAGPWYCSECGYGHLIKKLEDGVVLAPSPDDLVKTLVLLKQAGKHKTPIYIIVEGRMFVGKGVDPETLVKDQQAKDAYYYNSHTCPSNYLGVRIMEGDNPDPHGIFEHVSTIMKPKPDEKGRIITKSDAKFPYDYRAWLDLFDCLTVQENK